MSDVSEKLFFSGWADETNIPLSSQGSVLDSQQYSLNDKNFYWKRVH